MLCSVFNPAGHDIILSMKKTNKKRIFIWICIGAIVIGFVFMGFLTWRNIKASPQFSLLQMYRAIEKADYDKFYRYIDLDSVIDGLISEYTQSVSFVTIPEMEENYPAYFDFDQATKDLFQKELKSQIEKGEFMGLENLQIATVKDIFTVWNAIKVKMVEKIAHVTLSNGKNKEITFHMKQKGDFWQVIALEINEDLMSEYMKQTDVFQNTNEDLKLLENFESLKTKGKEAIEADKLSEGITLLEEALVIKYDEDVTEWLNEAYFERAEYFYSIGNKEKAIEDLSKIYPITTKAEELLKRMEE